MSTRLQARPLALAIAVAALLPTPGLSQRSREGSASDPFAPEGLGTGRFEEMSALLEVTIFKIDVLTLTVRVPPEAATRIASIVADRDYSEALADSVAAVVLGSDELWARQRFHRDVGFGRLLDGMRESSEKAAAAGFVSRAHHEAFSDSLPVWFDFLEEHGAKEGDQIVFHIRGDTVRTLYRTRDGRIPLDRRGVDPVGRNGSIPSFFAPGSRFRKRLVESLLQERREP